MGDFKRNTVGAEKPQRTQRFSWLFLKRYPYTVLALVLLLGLGWRIAAAAGKNVLHLQLLGMVLRHEPGPLPERTGAVTGLVARAAAHLHPDEAQAWLEAGLSDDSHNLTALQLCLWYWEAGRRADAAAACRQSQDRDRKSVV